MNAKLKKGMALATMALALGTSYSQLKISGEIRPRMEYRHGYKQLATTNMDNAIFVDQRTRLNLDYKKNRTHFKIVFQDVRTWGSQSQLVGNEAKSVSLHEAWGETTLKNNNFSLKFGRQELVYDDHRILGSVGWAQQARSHDALLLKYGKDKFKLHIGIAYNQDKGQLNTTSYTIPKSYKSMQYLWTNYKINDAMKFSVLAMGVGQQVNFTDEDGKDAFQDNYTLTAGTRYSYKKDKISANVNLYYQLGSTSTWPANDVSAYDLGFDFGYQTTESFKVTLGYEMLSGNSQTDTSASYAKTQHAFTPFFGTNHKFNGYMDYFYVGNHIGNVGLNDMYLRFDYKHSKFTTGLTAHAFMANADVLDQKELINSGNIRAMNPYLGAEIDVFAGFKLAPGTTCKVGYSQMLGTSTMEAIKGGDMNEMNNWGYIMLIMKPTLFQGK